MSRSALTSTSDAQPFLFKEVDQEGLDTLSAIEQAKTFNRWMYSCIRPYCSGQILEIGSGIGNISECFFADGYDLSLSDVRDNYCAALQAKFAHEPHLRSVIKLDLVAPDFEQQYAQLLGTFDTVFALNVVEHIQDDALAIANCRKLLRLGGNLAILVPAYQALYNRFDEELEHYRRYNQSQLNGLLQANQFRLLHHQYFNFMGIFGWFISGKLQRNKTIPPAQMALYNYLVPIFKIVDRLVFHKVGLSVISIGQK